MEVTHADTGMYTTVDNTIVWLLSYKKNSPFVAIDSRRYAGDTPELTTIWRISYRNSLVLFKISVNTTFGNPNNRGFILYRDEHSLNVNKFLREFYDRIFVIVKSEVKSSFV